MAKKQKTEKLTTISLDILDHVTGGRGGGPGPLHKTAQAKANPWASIVPSEPAPVATPSFAGFGQTARQGQAGTAGTPGAYVHNGKFRPL
jgi:hypothetical protein